MICYIYALVDPQTDEVFYIGSSIAPNYRFNSHIHGSTNEANQKRIEQITANGYELKMRILEEVPEEMRLEREKEWIDRLKEEGTPLTNIRLIDKEETKQAQIIVIVPDELHHKVKLQAAKEGRTISDKLREFLIKWVEQNEQTKSIQTGGPPARP